MSTDTVAFLDRYRALLQRVPDEGEDVIRRLTSEPDAVAYRFGECNGVRVQWAVPDAAELDAVFLYFHGGGYVRGSLRTHERVVGHLAKAASCTGLAVEYSLAPARPFPAAVDDAMAVYRALLADRAPSTIAFAGDSAGGGLTVAALVAAKDAGLPQPAAAVAFSPWVDMTCSGASYDTNATADYVCSRDGLSQLAPLVLAGADPRTPTASPLFADLSGLAPLYVQVGGDEVLLDDARELVRRAAAQGVDSSIDVFEGMPHVFQIGVGTAAVCDDAVGRAGAFLHKHLG